jgi:hypothetical protein
MKRIDLYYQKAVGAALSITNPNNVELSEN